MEQNYSLVEATHHFKSIPWCVALLERPGVITFTPTSRLPEDPTGHSPTQDQLFRKTLNNADTVPHCIGFYQDPVSSDLDIEESPSASLGSSSQLSPKLFINSAPLIFDLCPGVNGYNGTAQGGFISSLIDEAMGNLIFTNYQVQGREEAQGRRLPRGVLNLNNARFFTASMTVRFLKHLPTPQTVVVTASLNRIEGRKMSLDVTVKNKHQVEFARCDGLWMSLPKEKM
ncbi:HotDog domain-containing protein [Daldinia decipiens]|uniref:HotDog domain-containing protein n=1 Tax=Daldinia decipiens TaxID=326647 RepID=UPI0020C59710|nr:HotDog domain-containing protein [Daldinia decipiens]KAI1653681.1 HotDog domain-containing protein [Daldinia decipiens]